jgi:hypothetical protein
MTEKILFQFPNVEDASAIEDDLALAIFAAQCVHGRPQTRLQVRYLVTDDGDEGAVEIDGPAGEMALRVFLGLCAARFGEDGFLIEKSATDSKAVPSD